MIADLPLDAANLAQRAIPIWDKQTIKKVVMRESIGEEEKRLFNEALEDRLSKINMNSTTEMYQEINDAIREAAVGTIAEEKHLQYPKPVSKLKDYTSTDYPLRTWRARMKGAMQLRTMTLRMT